MTAHTPHTMNFDLLSDGMQRRMQQRLAQQQGNVDQVSQEIRHELARLDQHAAQDAPADRRAYQAKRALLVAQLSYFAQLAQMHTQRENDQPRRRSFWSRFRSAS
jgi:hypothetical protein